MATQTTEKRKERATSRALARSALYQLLSQALAYPSQEAVTALKEADLPQARGVAAVLSERLAPLLATLHEQLDGTDATQLQAEHRRVFSHTLSPDCPPCETYYTARQVFQETQELSDIRGFLRAFGLEIADKERPDHISIELEFMHFLTYKEAYALTHHSRAKGRLCRDTQRKFMQDHLGRWALEFAGSLKQKAGGGYFASVASLIEAFVPDEIDSLGARPETPAVSRDWRSMSAESFTCPVAEGCP